MFGKRSLSEISKDLDVYLRATISKSGEIKTNNFKVLSTKDAVKKQELKISDDVSVRVGGEKGQYIAQVKMGYYSADLTDKYYKTLNEAKIEAVKALKGKGFKWQMR